MYSWEHGRAGKKKVRATGTVVFHPNDHVELEFDQHKLLSDSTATTLRDKLKFDRFLPAQAHCFKGVHKKRDVVLHSRTGSGKTLAYALPVIERQLAEETAPHAGPFALLFVFSNELAVQTQSVLRSVYGTRINVAVAGFDEISAGAADVDVLIGTVQSIDTLVRGSSSEVAKADDEDEEADPNETDDDDDGLVPEVEPETKEDKGTAKKRGREGDAKAPKRKQRNVESRICLTGVRAVVVDEVDVTLGPKFSLLGRRFKNLLKTVRRANGTLSSELQKDFRVHHYVLCGATIPNWVLKAGFLGEKKYYYQLVDAGTTKLPTQLECFAAAAPQEERVAKAAELVVANPEWFGRTVVFGNKHQVERLERVLNEAIKAAPAPKAKKGKKAAPATVVRTLTASDEMDRIRCIQDFNDGAATVLLCTDAAARGLDFVAVQTVLMLQVPSHVTGSETFVHRAGRTARVNHTGRVVVLYDAERDGASVKKLESVTHVTFKPLTLTATEAAAKVAFRLVVKSAFTASKVKPPSPAQVLRKALITADVESLAEDITEPAQDVVQFSVPAGKTDVLRKALWKYRLEEVTA